MIITQFDARHLLATIPLAGQNFTLLGAFPGYSRWEGRSLRFRPTAAGIEYILEHWPDIEWSEEAREYKERLSVKRDVAKDTAILKKLDDAKFKTDFAFKTAPYDHQTKAFMLSRERENFALFMEQGTGKTKVTIDTAAYLAQQGKINALVVVAPKGVHEMWVLYELPKHMPDWLEYDAFAHPASYPAYKRTECDRVLDSEKFKIITINIEGLAPKKSKKGKTPPSVASQLFEYCLENFRCLLVIDESSRIRNGSAKRTKYIIKESKSAPYKRILSGTPVTQGSEHLYSQMLFLDPDITGYDTYTSFKQRYCLIRTLNFGEIIYGYQNQEELIEKIDGFSYRVLKDDCLDLPPKVYKSHPVHISRAQSKLYKELVKEFMVEHDGELMTAELAIVRLLRCQQIISGWFKGDDEKLRPIDPPEDNPRAKALKTILADVTGKVVIWARFVADLKLIKEILGEEAVLYDGDLGDVERFQTDPECRYFIANPASGGIGITLTAAETVVYYSNNFDLEHRLQSEDRTHRIGTTGTVTYIDLIAEKTVDTKIVNALRNKKRVADAILQDPENFFMEYQNE